MLGMPEARVRSLARDALVELAPVSANRVEEDWRGSWPTTCSVRAGPRRPPPRAICAARRPRAPGRARCSTPRPAVSNGSMPVVPEGERGPRARGAPGRPRRPLLGRALARGARGGEAAPAGGRRGELRAGARRAAPVADRAARRRRRGRRGWPVGRLPPADRACPPAWPWSWARATSASCAWTPPAWHPAPEPSPIRSGSTTVPGGRARSAQVTDRNGTFQGTARLPEGFERYSFIDLSREPLNDRDERPFGVSVLRGRCRSSSAYAASAPPCSARWCWKPPRG